jgi:chemotaxis protein methyltransferase CheR
VTPGSLSPAVFTILGAIIEERAGLHYRIEDLEILRAKVLPRAQERGFDSLLDYYYFLRYDPLGPAELDALIDALVVHETYFFREKDQLHALVEEMRGQAPVRTFRIWCAGCASGEEAITLQILLARAGLLERVQIVASDISKDALDRARRGEYAAHAGRAVPADIPECWLARREKRIEVSSFLRETIDWRRVNLTDSAAVRSLGKFDHILCRNVLIYFGDKTVRKVVQSLSEALEPGGFLLVGASESLLRRGTSLSCEERGGAFLYRRAT